MKKDLVNGKIFLICFIFAFLTLIWLFAINKAWAQGPTKKIKAPTFSLPTIFGEDNQCSVREKSDKYTVLMFWTTWCPHCRAALSDMQRFFQKYKDKIDFCAVAVGEKLDRLVATAENRKLTFPIANDVQGIIAYMYAVMGVPTIVVIDKKGYVVDYGFNLRGIMKKLVDKI